MSSFADTVTLITGSSRGIGAELARDLGRAGGTVVVNYKKNAELADKVVSEIGAAGGRGLAVQADVEEPTEIDRLFDAVAEEFGRLDFFVSNAAASAFKPIEKLEPHHLDRSYAMNVRSFVLGAKRALGLMRGRGGRIVAMSSYGSVRAYPTYANLGAAKAAIEAWVRYMALEFASYGVNVNAVNGGLIQSDSLEYFYSVPGMADISTVLPKIPKGRPGELTEVAATIRFLLEPASAYITGQSLLVDGGLSLVAPPFGEDLTPPLASDV